MDCEVWNPLEDDGDAIRLALELRLVIDTDYNGGVAVGNAEYCMGDFWQPDNGDRGVAMRYAIVQVAAEIGKKTN